MDVAYDQAALAAVCQKYQVVHLEVFGSQARGQAGPESDVDILVTFADDYNPGIYFFALAEELETVFGRSVDVLTRSRVERDENPYFKRSVLSAVESLYAA